MRQKNVSGVRPRYPICLLILIVVVFLLIWPFADRSLTCPTLGIRYGIMMDAGSTGSRIHVYKFNSDEQGKITLLSELFREVEPGLSSYRDSPSRAAESIRPLLEEATRVVPAGSAPCTPILLKATAGLRLIGQEKARAILDEVERILRSTNFHVRLGSVTLMEGRDEGPFAWLTVNFLRGSLHGEQTAAVLDMGGGSTQVVFFPDRGSVLENAPAGYVYDVRTQGSEFRLYQHSYLGYGLKEAEKTLKGMAPSEAPFPCFGAQQLNFGQCLKFTSKMFETAEECSHPPCSFAGVYQPSLDKEFSGPVYAFSYFYDKLHPYLNGSEIATVGHFRNIGEKVCEGTEELFVSNSNAMSCMDFAYLYSVLHVGYGLPDSRELHITKKINGVETAWTLGAMILGL